MTALVACAGSAVASPTASFADFDRRGKAGEALRVEFEGNLLGFFGEASHDGLDFSVTLDGNPLPYVNWKRESGPVWPFSVTFGQGNLFVWRRDCTMLPSGTHVLAITPLIPEGVKTGQLRIESV